MATKKTPKPKTQRAEVLEVVEAEALPLTREEKAYTLLRLMHSGLSLRKAAHQVGIGASTFLDWVKQDTQLAEQYAHAREALIDKLADELLEIADAPVGTTDMGGTDSGAVAKQRLQVDTRKWILSKLAPKKYGDRLELAGDAANPIAVSRVERIIIDPTANRN